MMPFRQWRQNRNILINTFPDSKVHGACVGPTWDRQDPGGPHVGPVNLAITVLNNTLYLYTDYVTKGGKCYLPEIR